VHYTFSDYLLPGPELGGLGAIATLPFLLYHPYGVLSFPRWALDVGAVTSEGGLLGISMASNMAIVVAIFFGYLDGEEQDLRDPAVDGVSAIVTLT
jgi:hypothetical protein